jgi:rubrerythrin
MTEVFRSTDDVLRFAIAGENEAAQGYVDLAAQAKSESARAFLLELWGEELQHARLLEGLDMSALPEPRSGAAKDLRISDYVVDEPLGDDPSFQDLLIFAAKKEAKAAALYGALAAQAVDAAQKKLFEFLVGQEKSHKLRLEQEYEKYILPED